MLKMEITSSMDTQMAMEPSTTTNDNTIEIPQVDWLQQMYDLDSIQWKGGDNFFEGMHDSYCYVCGSGLELFECQTCSSSYHAECMTPSLDPEIVPNFWFCPHCVDREHHIPPSQSIVDELSPSSTRDKCSTHSESVTESTVGTIEGCLNIPETIDQMSAPPLVLEPSVPPSHKRKEGKVSVIKPGLYDKSLAGKGKTSPVKKASLPPRKKSKYSAFSATVDKALSVIHSELEAAAQSGKSEDVLQEKIKALEQQLKVQEGELQLARNERSNERLRNERLRKEVSQLKEDVQQKDNELKDWQEKLKNLMGGPAN